MWDQGLEYAYGFWVSFEGFRCDGIPELRHNPGAALLVQPFPLGQSVVCMVFPSRSTQTAGCDPQKDKHFCEIHRSDMCRLAKFQIGEYLSGVAGNDRFECLVNALRSNGSALAKVPSRFYKFHSNGPVGVPLTLFFNALHQIRE